MPATVTITKTLYQFAELSDAAKEKEREWWRSASEGDNFFSEYVIEDAKQCAALMGLVIDDAQWSGFWSQGDGFAFAGRCTYQPGAVAALKKHAPEDSDLQEIALSLQHAQRRFFYKLIIDVSMGRGNNIRVNVEHSENRYMDVSAVDREIDDAMISFCSWVYQNLEKEYEYQNSDAQIDETIIANEYTFDKNGNRDD